MYRDIANANLFHSISLTLNVAQYLICYSLAWPDRFSPFFFFRPHKEKREMGLATQD